MIAQIIITVIADDRPGVVETLADIIARLNGNWLESQLMNIHGKFSGIVAVAIPESRLSELQNDLDQLADQGFAIASQRVNQLPNKRNLKPFKLTIVGPDRPGIVKEVSSALANRGINLTKLTSECSSMPWSGEPMFTAQGLAHIPQHVNMVELDDDLDAIAEELGLDIALEDRQEA